MRWKTCALALALASSGCFADAPRPATGEVGKDVAVATDVADVGAETGPDVDAAADAQTGTDAAPDAAADADATEAVDVGGPDAAADAAVDADATEAVDVAGPDAAPDVAVPPDSADPADTQAPDDVAQVEIAADVPSAADTAAAVDVAAPDVAPDTALSSDTADPVDAQDPIDVAQVDTAPDLSAPDSGATDVAADAEADVPAVPDATAPADVVPGEDALDAGMDAGADIGPPCTATAEVCNGQDDDCDGLTDEPGAEASCVASLACAKSICVFGGCVDVPDAAASGSCDDGNACTGSDACAKGYCVGALVNCSDGNVCSDDGCAAASGCMHAANADACSDGDACSAGDGCAGMVCKGLVVNCEDGNGCTADSCDKTGGCQHAATTAACDDGDACTGGDACKGGKCAGALTNCSDGNVCTDDGCAAASGCTHGANADACSDGDACSAGDGCAGMVCKGLVVSCEDGNGCTADSCDKTGGCQHAATTAACDDGDACTGGDVCKDGKCAGAASAACDDGNACTGDACSAGVGCVHFNLDAACSDGDKCSVGDACAGGSCKGQALNCADADPCTADACDASGSCKHTSIAGCLPTPCVADADCASGACDPASHACVACLSDSDCASGVCIGKACVAGIACSGEAPCKASGQVCDLSAGHCVACLTSNDCGAGETCVAKACVVQKTCKSNNECPVVCADGVCAACNVAADCGAGQWCASDHTCHLALCAVSVCKAGAWYACKADGSGFAAAAGCDDGNPCTTDTCDVATGCSNLPTAKDSACPGGLCDGAGVCKGVVQVAAGYSSTCAIDKQGQAWCWGRNDYGQLGDGTTLDRVLPTKVVGMEGQAAAIATAGSTTCAVNDAGKLWCWGRNYFGQLANGSTGSSGPNPTPVAVGVPAVSAVATTGSTVCALGKDGTVWCWGQTQNGETGVGTTGADLKQPSPQKLISLGPAQALAAGSGHFCALLQAGSVMCWGTNDCGRLGNGQGNCTSQIATAYPVSVVGLSDAVAIAASSSTTCAVREDGAVWCWGSNGSGQLGIGKTYQELAFSNVPMQSGLTEAVAVTPGGTSGTLCALRKDQTGWCWGDGSQGGLGVWISNLMATAPVQVASLQGVTGLSGRCAVTADGRAWCWGNNLYGQAGDGTKTANDTGNAARLQVATPVALPGIGALAAGYSSSCALAGGKMSCWGDGWNGQLGHGGTASAALPVAVGGLLDGVSVAAIAGGSGTTCAVAAGKVYCWGSNSSGILGSGQTYAQLPEAKLPQAVIKVTGSAQTVTIGNNHACALVAGGLVECWGGNTYGQSTTTGVSAVLEVGAGDDFTCVRIAGGKVQCWGRNYVGQLGNGGTNDSPAPGEVVNGPQTATDLAVGQSHACMLRNLTEVHCWGYNDYGQGGTSPTLVAGLPEASSVFAGRYHNCAIATTGEPWCWGAGSNGQLGNGKTGSVNPTPTKVLGWTGKATAMALGAEFTCALRDDGQTFCWGSTSQGQMGDGTAWKATPVQVQGLP